jgi:hexulose-6-phosphate isomerase
MAMLKGMCQRYFPQTMPLDLIFDKCKKAGFDAVELAINKKGAAGITPETTLAEAKAIRQLGEEKGIALRSFMFGGGPAFVSADASERQSNREQLARMIEISAEIGIDTVLVVPGRVSAEMAYDICYERSLAELALVEPIARANSVHLAVENVWNNFLLSPLEFARYVDELKSTHVGAYFDVGNILKLGFPEQWIRILGLRIRKIHLKDFRVGVASNQGFVPLLSGDVNWKAVMAEIRALDYDDTLTAEYGPYAGFSDQGLYDMARHIGVLIDGVEQ